MHPDAILFFRLGDFYEMFDDDALSASKTLQIILTSREMGKGVPIPMCGVPYHAAEGYISQLWESGHKVAICDQVGQPGTGLVERQVTKVITPGTVVDDGMLSPDRNNYLAICVSHDAGLGIAYADVTTGEFVARDLDGDLSTHRANRLISQISPVELLLDTDSEIVVPNGTHVTNAPERPIDPNTALQLIADLVSDLTRSTTIGHRATIAAARLLTYIQANQESALHIFTTLHVPPAENELELDEFTKRNLELDITLYDGLKQGSLLGHLDRTKTPMGARMLRRQILRPICERSRIEQRLDLIEWMTKEPSIRASLRDHLRKVGDIERTAVRVRRFTVKAPELLRLGDSLSCVQAVESLLSTASKSLQWPIGHLDACEDLLELLKSALDSETEFTIRAGYSPPLDSLRSDAAKAKEGIVMLQTKLRKKTGIKSLKVGYNRVFGYYLEMSRAATNSVPDDFEPRQTLAHSQRYMTPQLKELEAAVLTAEEETAELEGTLYRTLLEKIAKYAGRLTSTAGTISQLDVGAALADVAIEYEYARPKFSDDGKLQIAEGRHPVVEAMQSQSFVPNNCVLGGDQPQIVMLTGPNMAGKSTYLRQVALIVLMAQTGCYVPAKSAQIPITDRIFTRVGAHDDIASGSSTFLVEMTELSTILRRATPNSLIVLDEIGRGTSTYDGLSIAKAVVEFLHNHPRIRSKTIFATHYHELTTLADQLPRVVNYNVAVAEQQGQVLFLHKIRPGASDRSYGIHVARLAGLPSAVTRRAEELLTQLESQTKVDVPAQMSLLPLENHPVLEDIENFDLDTLSPIEALNKLYQWRDMLDNA